MTNSGLGTEILVPSFLRYTNNLTGTNYRAGHGQADVVAHVAAISTVKLPIRRYEYEGTRLYLCM